MPWRLKTLGPPALEGRTENKMGAKSLAILVYISLATDSRLQDLDPTIAQDGDTTVIQRARLIELLGLSSPRELKDTLSEVRKACPEGDPLLRRGNARLVITHPLPSDTSNLLSLSASEGFEAFSPFLKRGRFLAGWQEAPKSKAFSEWARQVQERLETHVIGELAKIARHFDDHGDGETCIQVASSMRRFSPEKEIGHLFLARAFWTSGRDTDAQKECQSYAADLQSGGLDVPDWVGSSGHYLAPLEQAPVPVPEVVVLPKNAEVLPGPVAPLPTPSPPSRGFAHRAPRQWLATVIITTFVLGIFLFMGKRSQPTPVTTREDQVLIIPFRTAGAHPDVEHIGEAMMDLLEAKFTGDGVPYAISPRTVTARLLEDIDTTQMANVPPELAMRLARELGAARLILGSVTGNASELTLTANLLRVSDGREISRASVSGAAGTMLQMADSLARRLVLPDIGEPPHRWLSLSETPLDAFRVYLRGRKAARRGVYRQALSALDTALALDSTFALAALEWTLVAAWREEVEPTDYQSVLDRAWTLRYKLSSKDQLALKVIAGPGYPETATARERLATAISAARLIPHDPVLQHLLGDNYFHRGPLVGLPNTEAHAKTAFNRALAMDSNSIGSLLHLFQIAVQSRDTVEVRRLGRLYLSRDGTNPIVRWQTALLLGDERELRAVWNGLTPPLPDTVFKLVRNAQESGLGHARVDHAIDFFLKMPAENLAWRQHTIAMNAGRVQSALHSLRQLKLVMPRETSPWPEVWPIADALYWDGSLAAASEAAYLITKRLGRRPSPDDWEDRGDYESDLIWLAQWRFARGDTAAAGRAIRELRAAPEPPLGRFSWIVLQREIGIALLNVLLTTARGGEGPKVAAEQLDSLARTGPPLGPLTDAANLVLARYYEKAGDLEQAFSAASRRAALAVNPYFLSSQVLLQAQLAARLGDRDAATRAYRHYLALRSTADPHLQSQVDSARRQLARIGRADPTR